MKRIIAVFVLVVIAVLAVPHYTFAASLYLTPSSGNIVVGQEFTVSVLTDTEGASINTAESNITFTTNTLELVSVTQGSTFVLPAPASPNKGTSSAYFGGGIPNPGFSGKSGLLGVMTFRAKSAGAANINITRGNILLNDGSGTQAVTRTAGASFNITPGPVGNVVVTSSTHPLQSDWSNQNDLILNWTLPVGAVQVSYLLDQNLNTIPDDVIEVNPQNSISFNDLKDGEWYFHIKAKSAGKNDPFGQVTNYKIQVDVTAPLPFNISLLSETDLENVSETPTIEYRAVDASSGVYRYDVFLDDKLLKESTVPPYAFSKLVSGPHTLKVTAYDQAGNSAVSELPLNITAPGGQAPVTFDYVRKYLQVPLYGLIGLNVLILFVVIVVLRQNKKTSHMAAIQAIQIEAIRSDIRKTIGFEVDLSRLKKQIDVRFMDMARSQSLRAEEVRIDIGKKIEIEIERNVEKLKTEINARLTEAKSFGTKQFQKIHEDMKENIASEIQRSMQPVYMKNTDTKVKTEVLRRLYDEFMNNKIS
jgi:hypothetical protein